MSRVVSLVTLYNPTEKHVDNITRYSKQSNFVLLCDNSSVDNEEMFKEIENVKYIANYKNLGLSGAFNKVLKDNQFHWEDEDYIVFFDQDSIIEDNHIQKLTEEYMMLNDNGINVGCIGPSFFNNSNNTLELPKLYDSIDENNMSVKSIMTSSMVCKYKDLKAIGYWNEKIFLDLADWDICWRFLEKGFKCIMTKSVILNHTIGEGEKRVGPIRLRVGKPFREYYQTRDCIYLLKEKYTPFKYKVRFIAMLTIRPLLHILFLENKKERWSYIIKGIKDANKGITGELKQM